MNDQPVTLTEMDVADLPFLQHLWRDKDVRRYSDELPILRGWSKDDPIETAWQGYQDRCRQCGAEYRQLILRLADNTPIGESFYGPLPEGCTFGVWHKPADLAYVLGDIKLVPAYWHQGYGSTGMRLVVKHVFQHASCDRFVVPPHRANPAAKRVYEKAGFVDTGVVIWGGHHIFELSREQAQELYKEQPL